MTFKLHKGIIPIKNAYTGSIFTEGGWLFTVLQLFCKKKPQRILGGGCLSVLCRPGSWMTWVAFTIITALKIWLLAWLHQFSLNHGSKIEVVWNGSCSLYFISQLWSFNAKINLDGYLVHNSGQPSEYGHRAWPCYQSQLCEQLDFRIIPWSLLIILHNWG